MFNKYHKEIESAEVQAYIDNICNQYTVTEKDVVKMLIAERDTTNSIQEAMASVTTRIKYIML